MNKEQLLKIIKDVTFKPLLKDGAKRTPSIKDLKNGMYRIDTGFCIIDCGEGFIMDFEKAMKENINK